MSLLLLHPYLPGHRPESQAPTWAALARAEAAGFVVEHIALGDGDWAYCLALLARWDPPHDWIVVEHDIEPSAELLASLAACPQPLCCGIYAIHEGDDAFVEQTRADEVPWSVTAYLGCTKIAARARRALESLPVGPWWHYDSIICTALANAVAPDASHRWHLHHEPLTHHHRHPAVDRIRADV